MATLYQYHMTQHLDADTGDETIFTINLHFHHLLQIYYPETQHVPLHTINHFYTVPRQLLLSTHLAQGFIRFLLSETGVSSDFVEAVTEDISSFAFDMIVNDSCNAIPRSLTMVLDVLVISPYDDRNEIDRVISESVRDSVKFRAASRESIEGLLLNKMRVGGDLLDRNNECVICLDEFTVGIEVVRMPCGHVFHGDCIVRWLETSHFCPLCRYEMPP